MSLFFLFTHIGSLAFCSDLNNIIVAVMEMEMEMERIKAFINSSERDKQVETKHLNI